MKAFKHYLPSVLALVALALAPFGLAKAQVTVTAADPPAAPQGTVSLDVAVSGSGFDSTAAVSFFVTGTADPGGITVRKVAVKGPKRLIATIDVADTAIVEKFDIEVRLSNGRKGKGTTLFTVQAKTSSGDPCAVAGLDFPAFIYWKDGGKQTQDIFVADSTGKCSRLVIAGVTQAGASDAKFSYPVGSAGNVGRVVYRYYDGSSTSIAGVDFAVNGTAISVSPRYTIAPSSPFWLDLSADGQTLYYSTHQGIDGFVYGYLHKNYIPNQAGQPGTTIIADSPWLFGNMSVNAQETALYVVQWRWDVDGTKWLARVDLGPTATSVVIASGSSDYRVAANKSTSADRFAFAEFLGASGLDCHQIKIGEWTGTSASINSLPRYGRYGLTWYGGNVLTKTYRAPDRRGVCQDTGMISQIDPDSGQEIELVRGHDPEGR